MKTLNDQPPPEDIARAWELHNEGHALRYIGNELNISPEVARQYVRQGRRAVERIEWAADRRAFEHSVRSLFMELAAKMEAAELANDGLVGTLARVTEERDEARRELAFTTGERDTLLRTLESKR